MKEMKHIKPEELTENIFQLIGKDWMLLTAQKKNSPKFNMLTASWGGVGVLWGKPVTFTFVRPKRYTRTFLEEGETVTLSFFNEKYRDILNLCGTKSGRDIDKIAATGLTPVKEDGMVWYEEAKLVFKCRILYKDDFKEACFTDSAPLKWYSEKDFHRMYVSEITDVLTYGEN